MTKSRVSKYLPLMSVLLFISLIFITAALIWLLHFHLPLKNSLVKHECFLRDKSYEKKAVCVTQTKYTSYFSVEYTYKSKEYSENSCNFGRSYTKIYRKTIRASTCEEKSQHFDPRKPTCLKYTHPDLDFYNKFSKNKSHECWIFKDKPEMSTLDYPVTNYAWSAFFWIPALVFLCFDLFGLCTALVDWKRIKKERRIQWARNNIEMVPTKSGSESGNKKKKKDLTIEGRREKKQEKLEQDFFAIDAEKKKDLSLEENQQNL
ncbi:hypothetical protein M0812_20428 [Anaeramoeba flamelloides]|uniref:Uncharacterized protein n=1 Tax=Anaeramoeba flamelloides TaxID=1746091 RepID=A0AAV7YS66_9EUKA|nr:hypothetical protein M0812_20428 [Anaeramoeba flamelloides]